MRRAWLLPVLALVLAGCGGDASPEAELRADVAEVLDAANARDPDGVRAAVSALQGTLRRQAADQDLTGAQASQINAIALRIADQADLLSEVEPTPTPEPEKTEEPEETEEPTPTPTPEETEEPEPSEEPEPTEEPEQTEEPEPEVTVQVPPPPSASSPAAAPVSQGASSPAARRTATPTPQPTASS